MKNIGLFLLLLLPCALGAANAMPPISVDLCLDEVDYVVGERVRGVVDVKNMSPDKISVGRPDSPDRLFIEIFRASDMRELDRTPDTPFVSPFRLEMNEGQKLETFLGDHFALDIPRRYLARPVLVHNQTRFVGQYRAFDIVPGMEITSAYQMFAGQDNLSRRFKLLKWSRKGTEHLFVAAQDEGVSRRSWVTTDVGPMMQITKPIISILPTGEVVVIHRTGPDHFIRSEFWSMPTALELHSRELLSDPDTAGQNRVQEMYERAGGVKAKERPWWKIW